MLKLNLKAFNTQAIKMRNFKYQALEYRQTEESEPVYLFAAPCHEITNWAGIPRKEEKEGIETVGFQRTEDTKRIRKISHFLEDTDNIVSNPILCAVRNKSRISFESESDEKARMRVGILNISEIDYDSLSLKELLQEVEILLEIRLPSLKDLQIDQGDIEEFCNNSEEIHSFAMDDNYVNGNQDLEDDESEAEAEDQSKSDSSNQIDLGFYSESHIEDFFIATKLRRLVLEQINFPDREAFEGFSKKALVDYLHTVTVVDGQHRLLGSQQQLIQVLNSEQARNFQDQLLAQGTPLNEVDALAKAKYSRHLGVALISNDDWAEHVFQFVVVNQKATPIKSALLGSIIATTLTNNEVDSITERLGRADIDVADYRVVAFLDVASNSPFQGLIKRGYESGTEAKKKLDWSVFDRLVRMFRFLRGGKYFHQMNVDHAKNWCTRKLADSDIVKDYELHGFSNPYDYWSKPDGPWRDVFCNVWKVVQDQLATTEDDPELGNTWSYPKESNIFNDVYLSILGADFFAYLSEGRGITIRSADDATEITKEWLGDAKPQYFSRDWNLKGKGIKKSTSLVKITWSEVWSEYRLSGYDRVPRVERFCP